MEIREVKKRTVWAAVFLAILAAVLLPLTVYAQPIQPPAELPKTAHEALALFPLGLAMLAGIIANRLTDYLKTIPQIGDENAEKIGGATADFLAAIMSVVSGYVVGHLAVAADFLDTSGIWQVIVWAYPFALAWFEIRKRREVANG